jgi:hypothetical protein
VKPIVLKEKLQVDSAILKNLIENANGDIRFILNNLQLGILDGVKDIINSNMFETTKELFSICNEFDEKYNKYWFANDIHPLMIHENYLYNILKSNVILDNISNSADALSDYDIINNFMHTNSCWELEPYCACNSIHATLNCHNNHIQFTKYLGKLSKINANKKNGNNHEKMIDVFGTGAVEKVTTTKVTNIKGAKEKVAKEKVVKEKVVKEKVVKEKVVKEKVVKEKVVKEKVVKEKVVKEKVVKEKVVKEKKING